MTLLTVAQAADALGISRQGVHLLLGNGRLVADRHTLETLGINAIDSELVEAEKQRRVRKAADTLERLGYTVTLAPANA